jgi:hypothetical protein
VLSSLASALFDLPSAAPRTIRARNTTRCSVLPERTSRSSSFLASGVIATYPAKAKDYWYDRGHDFCKKLTCPKAEHVVRSVDGGEAHCTLNNPSLEHQIEFDWLDGVFKRELGRLHRAGLPAAGSHQLLLTHHNRLSGPMGLIRQSKYLFRLKEAADRVEPERD